MASSQPTDLELVTFNFIRTNYEKKHKQNVPMALKYLTLQFSNRIIGCKLLTIKQDLDFFKLLSTKLPPIRRFNHLFRASDHKYSAAKFHEHCDNKPGTIVIIKSNWGNIFGGYTSKSWSSDKWKYVSDKNAFLFLIESNNESIQIKCPLLLELGTNQEDFAINCNPNRGPTFGIGADICIRDSCNKPMGEGQDHSSDNYTSQHSYDTPIVHICGGNGPYFQVIDYSVFQIVS